MSMETKLPKVSFLILCYNTGEFIYETVKSAISQDYMGDMEIIISDDCSSDNSWEEIQRAIGENTSYFSIVANRNSVNLGMAANANWVRMKAQGEILVSADGDDISMPNRVSTLVNYYLAHPECYLLDSNFSFLCGKELCEHKQQGGMYGLADFLHRKVQTNGCTRSYRRILADAFPVLRKDCPTADSVFVLRACLYAKGKCGIGVLPMPLVQYRIHPNQVSNSRNISLIKRMGIYRQYRDDIAVAVRNHYVPLGYMFSLFCWLGRYHVAALLQYNSLWHKLRRGRK